MEKIKTYIFPSNKVANFLSRSEDHHVGREQVGKDFKTAIDSAHQQGGSFLVAGYRGVGKSALVRNQITTLKKEKESLDIRPIYINLGSDVKIVPKAIMSEMTEQLVGDLEHPKLQLTFYTLLALGLLLLISIVLSGQISWLAQEYIKLECVAAITCLLVSWVIYNKRPLAISRKLKKLAYQIRYERTFEIAVGSKANLLNTNIKTTLKQAPITARGIEIALRKIFEECSKDRLIRCKSIQYVFVFDELDKINPEGTHAETKDRKQCIDEMLGGLKALITSSKASFVFIAGREMMDSYHSEYGYTSGLYEGVFTDIFYIPTLLADRDDGKEHILHSQIQLYIKELFDVPKQKQEPEQEQKNTSLIPHHDPDAKFVLRVFIRYLTLHSWGNCKRLESYVRQYAELVQDNDNDNDNDIVYVGHKPKKGEGYFKFRSDHIRNFFHAAKIYSLLDYQITHQLALGDDKLIVSAMVSTLDLMKFHGIAFSREMLDRTIEGIDVHSESNLPHIITDLINIAFSPIIRRTTNNLFGYRFHSIDEEEFGYLSRVLGARAASQEFTLDSADPIKRYYTRSKKEFMEGYDSDTKSYQTSANIDVIMGDLYFWEGSLDKSYLHYSRAIPDLKRILRNPDENSWRQQGGVSFSTHYILVSTLLKKGLIDERRENYELASRYYREAQTLAQYSFENLRKRSNLELYDKEKPPVNKISFIQNINEWLTIEGQGKDKEGIRHRNMVVHAMLAADFLKLKFNRHPRVNTYQNINFTLGKTDAGMYGKILSLKYYLSEDPLSEVFKISEQLALFKASATAPYPTSIFNLRYLIGNYLLSDYIKELRGEEEEEEEEKEKEKINKWKSIVMGLSSKEKFKESANLEDNATDDTSERIHNYFTIIFNAASCLEERGLYASAMHAYISLLGHWIALLEIIPWVQLQGEGMSTLKEPAWLKQLITATKSAISKSDRGAYERERLTLLVKNAPYSSKEINKAFGLGNPLVDNPDMKQAFWYRSTSENYLIVLILWEKYARFRITGEDSDNPKLCRFSPPIGVLPRTSAIFDWLQTRNNHQDYLKLEDNSYEPVARILTDYYLVILGSKFGSPSEDPDTMPPKAIVYYNIFELLDKAYQKINAADECSIEEFQHKLIAAVKQFNHDAYTQFTLCNIKLVGEVTIRHLKELEQVPRYYSASYRRRIGNKFYLYDDFEDPLFIGECTQLQLLSIGAAAHIKQVEKVLGSEIYSSR